MKRIDFYIEKELSFLQHNLDCYLNYWPAEADKAGNGTWTLLRLAGHLYTLPAAYCALFNGAPEEELMRLWGGPWDCRTADNLRDMLNRGMTEIRSHKLLSANGERLIPWPFGDPLSPQEHLVNLITHMYHHRGQMHLLLKEAGAAVDSGTLYMIGDGQWRSN